MKNRKEQIAVKALELFALNGYEATSITELQYALDMSRGALYYYYKDKNELFEDVLQQFFLTPKQQCLDLPDTVTIPQMIDALCKYLFSLEGLLMHFDNQHLNTSSVVSIMNTAYNRFPDLYMRAKQIYDKEVHLWKCALRNEIKQGTIRSDIPVDTLAMMFSHIKDGFDTANSGMVMDFSIFPKQYNSLYSLLKK